MHQGPGPGLGAQPLLLPGDDPDQGREPDRALPRPATAPRVAQPPRRPRRRRARATAASRAGSSSPTGSASTATTSPRCAGCCRRRALRSKPMCISSPRRRCWRRSPPRSPSCSRRSSSASAWRACSRTTTSSPRDTLAYFSRAAAAGAARFANSPSTTSSSNATHAGAAALGAQGAGIQMRRAVGDARCALSRLCRAPAVPARRLRAATGSGAHVNEPAAPIAATPRPRLPRGVRLVHNEAQGGWVLLAPERVFKADADRRRGGQALHRRGDVRRHRRRSCHDLCGTARTRARRRDGAAARPRRQEASGIVKRPMRRL